MLIDYAINYYCWPGLQAFVLLRTYGCGCMDTLLNAGLVVVVVFIRLVCVWTYMCTKSCDVD